MTEYVELRCHSAFSFLDGASQPEDLVERAAELGYRALALTDRDGFYGAPRFYQATKRLATERATEAPRPFKKIGDAPADIAAPWPLKPIIGAELSLEGGTQLLVLVERREGYRNLSRLLTQVRLDAAGPLGGRVTGKVTPVIPIALLASHVDGLIALTGGLEGRLGQALAAGQDAEAERALSDLVEMFGARNVYVELQRHFDADEELRNRQLLRLASRAGLPLVATNDVRYGRAEDHQLHDVLTCVRHQMTVDEIGRRLLPSHERYLKAPAEMAALFRDVPEAVRTTSAVADRCAFTLADLGYQFPDYPTDGETVQQHLERLTWECARERFRPRATPSRSKGGPSRFCLAST
jgi:error-prone DNA polymerase